MTSLVTNCKRFFTESRVHRAGALGTWQWHSAHPMLAALADAAPSVCTRAAVEEASVTATATALAGLSLGQALKVGAGSSKVMKIGSHSPPRAESGAVRQKNQGPDLGQGQQYLAMVELQTDFWGLSLHTRANK